MMSLKLLFSFLFITTVLSVSNQSISTPPTGAHKELVGYGFPVGLLPRNIGTYVINKTSGEFFVDLGDTCHLTIPPDNYLATYSKRITGRIAENRIAELNGISVRAFFKWWGITGIRSSGENLVFEVGMVTAKFPSKNFVETPECEGKHSSS